MSGYKTAMKFSLMKWIKYSTNQKSSFWIAGHFLQWKLTIKPRRLFTHFSGKNVQVPGELYTLFFFSPLCLGGNSLRAYATLNSSNFLLLKEHKKTLCTPEFKVVFIYTLKCISSPKIYLHLLFLTKQPWK